jgi:flagellar biosynthetic protein FlhB
MMTREEVKEEAKQAEGNPQIKAKLRSLQRQYARARMMHAVPHADVVVTNPTHYAVALEYKPQKMQAPLVTAKGQMLIAEQIKRVAREHGVPVVENPPLARALYASVEIGDAIPPEMYQAVAEVLAFIYRLRRQQPSSSGS